MRYKNSFSVTILQTLIFTFRLLDLCPTSTSLSAKAGCFLTTSNIPVDVFLISQQNFWLLWCPLIPHRMIHPEGRLPSCFKPASLLPLSPRAILQLQGENITPTTVKNCCTISARRTCTPKLGQWPTGYETRAASCLRWVTGRWHPLAVKHTPYPRGSRADIVMSEVAQYKNIGPRNKATLVSHLPLRELRLKPMTTASMEKIPMEFSWPWITPR